MITNTHIQHDQTNILSELFTYVFNVMKVPLNIISHSFHSPFNAVGKT
jgi:hypothetical protein